LPWRAYLHEDDPGRSFDVFLEEVAAMNGLPPETGTEINFPSRYPLEIIKLPDIDGNGSIAGRKIDSERGIIEPKWHERLFPEEISRSVMR